MNSIKFSSELSSIPSSYFRIVVLSFRVGFSLRLVEGGTAGSLEANSLKKLIEIVYDLLIKAIQLGSFVVLEFGVRPVRFR
jgi:hypothetical protein